MAEGGGLCFIRIRPDPIVFTYGIGMSWWENMRRPRSAIGRAQIPDDRLPWGSAGAHHAARAHHASGPHHCGHAFVDESGYFGGVRTYDLGQVRIT